MTRNLSIALVVLCAIACTGPVSASVGSKLVQETIEFATRKFAKEVTKEGLEKFTGKVTKLAAKYGDQVVAGAFKKVGPRAGHIAVEAGEHGGVALRMLAQHGDKALSLTMKKSALGTVAKFGDDAAEPLMKHGTVGEELIGSFGKHGVAALARVTPQNGRRLAMLAGDGTLKPELLEVVARHGDRACDFIYRNKGALAIGTGLAAFVAAPEEFFDGTRELAAIAADAVVKPLVAIPVAVAAEGAKRVNWSFLLVVVAIGIGIAVSHWTGLLATCLMAARGLLKSR